MATERGDRSDPQRHPAGHRHAKAKGAQRERIDVAKAKERMWKMEAYFLHL